MKVISILVGNKQIDLATGLVWHPLKKTSSERSKQIKILAQESSFDFHLIRGPESAHIGFAKKSDGAKKGQISAAAVVAEALAVVNGKRNFLFAAPIPGDESRFMFVSAHEGVILVDGDMTGSSEEIRVRLTQDATYGGWNAIICPSAWGVPKSLEKDFSYFFNEKKLKKLDQFSIREINLDLKKILIPCAALLLVAFGGVYGLNFWKKEQAFKAEQFRIANEKLLKSQERPLAEPVKPWLTMARPQALVLACADALQSVGTVAGNWSLKSIDCSSGGLSVVWSKTNQMAWVSHFKELRAESSISHDGLTATVLSSLKLKENNDADEVLPTSDDISLHYFDLSSRYSMAATMAAPAAAAAPVVLPGQVPTEAPPVVVPFWLEIPVEIETIIDPRQAIDLISRPGLRIQKISQANILGQTKYTLTGIQYVQK